MNFELADQLYGLLKDNELDSAIQLAEIELKKITTTEFHRILGMNLLRLTLDLNSYISEFDKVTKIKLRRKKGFLKSILSKNQNVNPAAYYCELNGFTIDFDRWFIDLFSYEKYDRQNWDWLSEFYDSSQNDLTITGFEDIQNAFENAQKGNNYSEPIIGQAFEVTELLVILRLQELFKETYKDNNVEWTRTPMFVTAHDYEMIYKVN